MPEDDDGVLQETPADVAREIIELHHEGRRPIGRAEARRWVEEYYGLESVDIGEKLVGEITSWMLIGDLKKADEAKYVVVNEKTLCYRIEGSQFLGVLADSSNGGYHQSWVTIGPRDIIRPATRADFDAYRVSTKGHLDPVKLVEPESPLYGTW